MIINSGRITESVKTIVNDEPKKILDDFLKSASPDEIRELYRLLDKREKNAGAGKVDVQNLARNMSKQIQQQLGMTNLNTRKMAENMVVQLARKYKPEITDKELSQIVRSMVPEKKTGSSVKIPAAIIKTMVIQFIAYSAGDMSVSEKRDMPRGWEKKYWNAFPEEVRILIASYLKGNINKKEFWSRISRAASL